MHILKTTLHPITADALPRAYLGGESRDIPIISWETGAGGLGTFEIHLGNVPDAAEYLGDLARTLLALAAEVDAGKRDEREPGRRTA